MYSLVYMHGYGFVLLNIDQRNTVMLKIKKMGHQFFTFIRTFLQHQQLHVARKRETKLFQQSDLLQQKKEIPASERLV